MQCYSHITAHIRALSDNPALSEIQVIHCYSCPALRVEGVMPYVNK